MKRTLKKELKDLETVLY